MVDRGSLLKFQLPANYDFLDSVRACYAADKRTALPADFEPSDWTVICGRGKDSFNHGKSHSLPHSLWTASHRSSVGNRRFRILCEIHLGKYKSAANKTEKSSIIASVVDTVRGASKRGSFVKFDTSENTWYEVEDSVAREKVGQQFRETIMRSTRKEKKARTEPAKPKQPKALPRRENADKRSSENWRTSLLKSGLLEDDFLFDDEPAPCISSDVITSVHRDWFTS